MKKQIAIVTGASGGIGTASSIPQFICGNEGVRKKL